MVFNDSYGAFVSKSLEFSKHLEHLIFSRQANRLVNTGSYSVNIDGVELTEEVFNTIITSQLDQQLKDPNDPLRSLLKVRIAALPHSESFTKKQLAAARKHTDYLYSSQQHESTIGVQYSRLSINRLVDCASHDEVLQYLHRN